MTETILPVNKGAVIHVTWRHPIVFARYGNLFRLQCISNGDVLVWVGLNPRTGKALWSQQALSADIEHYEVVFVP